MNSGLLDCGRVPFGAYVQPQTAMAESFAFAAIVFKEWCSGNCSDSVAGRCWPWICGHRFGYGLSRALRDNPGCSLVPGAAGATLRDEACAAHGGDRFEFDRSCGG